MLLPTWLTQKPTSRVAFLLGGTDGAVRELLTGPDMPPLTTVCDRATAEKLSQAAILEGLRPPSVLVSRGFRQDCEALIATPRPHITLVHVTIFAVHMAAESSRLANRLQLLGGYEVPASLVERVALAGVWQHAENISHRLAAPLLIHLDQLPAVPMATTMSPNAFTVFEFPVGNQPPTAKSAESKRSSKRDAKQAATLALAPNQVLTAAVSADAAAAHATFLADMDLALLCTLHSALVIDRDQTIFNFWDNTLTAYEKASGQTALVIRARSKLAAIRARVLSAAPS
jgi:hypothetical protein